MTSILTKFAYSAVIALILCSCARYMPQDSSVDDCASSKSWGVRQANLKDISKALESKVDTRRRKMNLNDFCAYRKATPDGKYAILNIWDKVGGNHASSSWIIIGQSQVIDTHLNDFTMGIDTIKTYDTIIESVNQLNTASEVPKNDLVKILVKEARYYSQKRR